MAYNFDTSGNARGVTINGNYAYVADSDSGLQIIDISNPAAPSLVGSYDTSGWAEGVTINGTTLMWLIVIQDFKS